MFTHGQNLSARPSHHVFSCDVSGTRLGARRVRWCAAPGCTATVCRHCNSEQQVVACLDGQWLCSEIHGAPILVSRAQGLTRPVDSLVIIVGEEVLSRVSAIQTSMQSMNVSTMTVSIPTRQRMVHSPTAVDRILGYCDQGAAKCMPKHACQAF